MYFKTYFVHYVLKFLSILTDCIFLHIVSVEEMYADYFRVTFYILPVKQMYLSYFRTAHSLLYINCSFSVPIRLCWISK